jgi:hypothetical protein
MLTIHANQLEAIRTHAAETDERLKELIQDLNNFKDADGVRFRDAGPVEGESYGALEVLAEARRIAAKVSSLRPPRTAVLRTSGINQVQVHLQDLSQWVENLAGSRFVLSGDNGPLKLSSGSAVIQRDSGQQIFQMQAQLRNIAQAMDGLAGELCTLVAPGWAAGDHVSEDIALQDASAIANLRSAAESGSAAVQSASAAVQAILDELQNAQIGIQARAEELANSLQSQVTQAESAGAVVQTLEAAASSASAVINSKLDDVNKWAAQAHGASEQIKKYSSELDSVQKRVQAAEAKASLIVSSLDAQKVGVDELIKQANAMVSGATAVGLATAFNQERQDLDERMKGSMRIFAAGIVLIIVSTSLLAAYVFQLKSDIPIPGLSGGQAVTLSGFLVRAVILLGPVWLTLFATRRYRRLFDLRQQYSHKYAMALSVDGFQRQAPTYKEQIAYWVFQTVGASPVVGGSDARGGMDEHPISSLREFWDSIVDRFAIVPKKEG